MSHFYGTLSGSAKTTATRRGHKSTGVQVVAASWAGAIETEVFVDGQGRDCFRVTERQWHGVGVNRLIAEGVIGAA